MFFSTRSILVSCSNATDAHFNAVTQPRGGFVVQTRQRPLLILFAPDKSTADQIHSLVPSFHNKSPAQTLRDAMRVSQEAVPSYCIC